MKRNNRGFTLMEMLIVVAIIAILIAIAVPAISSALSKAKEATCAANRRSLQTQLVGEQISMDGKTLQDVWNGAGAENQKEWREKYICPAGGTITVNKNGIICSKHGDIRTIEEILIDDFDKIITSWDPTKYGSNDKFREEFLKQYGSFPQVEINGKMYYAQPCYDKVSKDVCIFARTDTANNWYTSYIYDKDEGEWYTGNAFSVNDQSWEKIKATMNEKGWKPVT